MIADLHYKVIRVRPTFSRAGHALIMYRHDTEGKPFIYHVEMHYGDDGRYTRGLCFNRARDIVHRKAPFSFDGCRSTFIPASAQSAVRKLGLF